MIVSFTGHRPSKIGGFSIPNPTYDFINKSLREILIELQPEKAISGMALGVDQWAAELCVELNIPFIAAVPFIGQEKTWPKDSIEKYNQLASQASEAVIVSEGGYSAWKMFVRNEWMVDNSDLIIAVWDGTNGGTGHCVSYVRKVNKPIIIIDPIKQIIVR